MKHNVNLLVHMPLQLLRYEESNIHAVSYYFFDQRPAHNFFVLVSLRRIEVVLYSESTGAEILKAVQNNAHQELISLWVEQNTKGLRNEQLVHLYGSAFGAIERRCLTTLSSVTINVVIDRVLNLGSKKYPFFSLVTIEPSGLSLKGLIPKKENYKTAELRDGLSYLLAEFLTVIGNITSNVLSESLHKELMEVTSKNVFNKSELQRGDE